MALGDGQRLPQRQKEGGRPGGCVAANPQGQGGNHFVVKGDFGGAGTVGKANGYAAHMVSEGQSGQAAALPDALKVQDFISGGGGQQAVQQGTYTGDSLFQRWDIPGGFN